jgi:3,4-dihydroxy 2-butanone 4-phosphate synthase/GTP cyclohydrolase II
MITPSAQKRIRHMPRPLYDGVARPPTSKFDHACAQLAIGRPIVLIDSAAGDGALAAAADKVSDQTMAFMVRYTSGLICVSLPDTAADRLQLPLLDSVHRDRNAPAYCVAVDAADGGTTGISAHDRALSARILARPDSDASDLLRPGHTIPVRVSPGGSPERRGNAEVASEITTLAGCGPVAVFATIVSDEHPLDTADPSELYRFATTHKLATVETGDLFQQLQAPHSLSIERVHARLPLLDGVFTITSYQYPDGSEHVAIHTTATENPARRPGVYLHVECLTGDVFDSLACDCHHRLRHDLTTISRNGGALIYLRPKQTNHYGPLAHLFHAASVAPGAANVPCPVQTVDHGYFSVVLDILLNLNLSDADLYHFPEELDAFMRAADARLNKRDTERSHNNHMRRQWPKASAPHITGSPTASVDVYAPQDGETRLTDDYDPDTTISATRIRAGLASGNVEAVAKLLGHPHRADGIVIHGEQRGRQLGYPTANLRMPDNVVIPGDGVYAGRVVLLNDDGSGPEAKSLGIAAVSIGNNPTFAGRYRSIEAFILDFDGDLYGKLLGVEFCHRLRGMKRFDTEDNLIAQIAIDVTRARTLMTGDGNADVGFVDLENAREA